MTEFEMIDVKAAKPNVENRDLLCIRNQLAFSISTLQFIEHSRIDEASCNCSWWPVEEQMTVYGCMHFTSIYGCFGNSNVSPCAGI